MKACQVCFIRSNNKALCCKCRAAQHSTQTLKTKPSIPYVTGLPNKTLELCFREKANASRMGGACGAAFSPPASAPPGERACGESSKLPLRPHTAANCRPLAALRSGDADRLARTELLPPRVRMSGAAYAKLARTPLAALDTSSTRDPQTV
eukprot:scaffold14375_cov133-Isochrysis_galbana.AAC.11